MKHAIDNSVRGISGWISCEEEVVSCVRVYLSYNKKVLFDTGIDQQRDDVKALALHNTGFCGFLFDKTKCSLISGNIYEVTLELGDFIVSRNILWGEKKDIIRDFQRFEIPRDDNSVQQLSLDEIRKKFNANDILLLKVLLIRLRRGKRGKSAKKVFFGSDYEYCQSDYEFIINYWDRYKSELVKVINPRFIVSFIDTISDFSSDLGEKNAAVAVSNILAQERFAQSWKCVYDFTEKSSPVLTRQLHYWGGMHTNRMIKDDAYDIFLTRNFEMLKPYPLLSFFFSHLLKEMYNSDSSILNFNCKYSSFFSDRVKDYI
ncbi:hypothetical protein AADZ84_11130 [Colwelliaceae bacterium MEBiC 14330]